MDVVLRGDGLYPLEAPWALGERSHANKRSRRWPSHRHRHSFYYKDSVRKIVQPRDFAWWNIPGYIPASENITLPRIAADTPGAKYSSSTSSISPAIACMYHLLPNYRDTNFLGGLSEQLADLPSHFAKYHRRQFYHYSQASQFVLRAQIDCRNAETGEVFDVNTTSVSTRSSISPDDSSCTNRRLISKRYYDLTWRQKLPEADCDIWSDGSVGEYAGDPTDWKKRASVKWDDGWFSGTVNYQSQHFRTEPNVVEYEKKRGEKPSFWIEYDDGYQMAYGYDTNTKTVVDADGDTHPIRFLQPTNVAAAAFEIGWKHRNVKEAVVVPAGIQVCSFTAEVRALLAALKTAQNRLTGVLRIFTDCLSLIDALQGNIRKQCSTLQLLAQTLAELSAHVLIYISWIPSHCGFEPNERVDQLAKSGLGIPLMLQVMIPMDYSDVRAAIGMKTKTKSIAQECFSSMKDVREIRKIEVTLAQFATGHVRELHPVSTFVDKALRRCKCGTNAKKTAEHIFFRCPLSNLSRRNKLPTARERKDRRMMEMIRQWPSKFLAFLRREGYI